MIKNHNNKIIENPICPYEQACCYKQQLILVFIFRNIERKKKKEGVDPARHSGNFMLRLINLIFNDKLAEHKRICIFVVVAFLEQSW